jgi:hypothetical protein
MFTEQFAQALFLTAIVVSLAFYKVWEYRCECDGNWHPVGRQMRRYVDREWEYRTCTEEEAEKALEFSQW